MHSQQIFGMLSTDFQKNRLKISILSMLNLRFIFALFSEKGLRKRFRKPLQINVVNCNLYFTFNEVEYIILCSYIKKPTSKRPLRTALTKLYEFQFQKKKIPMKNLEK